MKRRAAPTSATSRKRARDRTPPALDCTETELLRWVLGEAAAGGWIAYHAQRPFRDRPGFPDLILARGDVVAFVELKRARGPKGGGIHEHVEPSDVQIAWLDAAMRAQFLLSSLWRPGDVPRITAFLAGEDPEPPGLWKISDGSSGSASAVGDSEELIAS